MDVKLHPDLASSLIAREGAEAIEACVHCGFCLATCPTYLDSRDERDSPRGRIYLIKELLETAQSDRTAQYHLDRCLTCRSCETTCPSGVRYGDIIDSGRTLLEEKVSRRPVDYLRRKILRLVVPYRHRIGAVLRLGQLLSPVLPMSLRSALPDTQRPAAAALQQTSPRSSSKHAARVILLEGCVQGSATPATNAAAKRVLDLLQIAVINPHQGCCGALDMHLGARNDGLNHMRRNIDRWWPAIDQGIDAIISTATGCGSQLADYGQALAHDSEYAERAAIVASLAEDFASYLLRQPLDSVPLNAQNSQRRIAVQIPCSQTHALQQADTVRRILQARGFTLTATFDDHLCCGSAGSYSLLQPAMSSRLRARKLQALLGGKPELIVSANVGCQLHLNQTSPVPVRHWTELLLDSLVS
ncbi:MAG: glycolate oxidase subunit GlcF [Congregibacter sp.]